MSHSSFTSRSYKLEDWSSPELFTFLPEQQKELVQDSLDLLRFHGIHVNQHAQKMAGKSTCPCELCVDDQSFHDFAFIVFPMAKAFEGFLKYYLMETHVITKERYKSRDLRIGRSLNPDLPERFRDEEWYFDDIARQCNENVARDIWELWLEGRNHLFHYFPDDRYQLSYHEAADLIHRFVRVMEEAIACRRDHRSLIE